MCYGRYMWTQVFDHMPSSNSEQSIESSSKRHCRLDSPVAHSFHAWYSQLLEGCPTHLFLLPADKLKVSFGCERRQAYFLTDLVFLAELANNSGSKEGMIYVCIWLLDITNRRANWGDTLCHHRLLLIYKILITMSESGRAKQYFTLSVRKISLKSFRCVEMSIVPWWYARVLTILYADPEMWGQIWRSGLRRDLRHEETHLILSYTNIIPFIHTGIDSHGAHRAKHDLRGDVSIERLPRKVYWKIGVSQVLVNTAI